MSTKIWPDPRCSGPHKVGQRLLRWQHTAECKAALPFRIRTNGEEIGKSEEDEANLVARARSVGAI